MEKTTKDRLLEYLAYSGKGQTVFEKEAGISNGYINNLKGSIGPKIMNKIIAHCLDLNASWLLTGEGNMLKTQDSTGEPETASDSDTFVRGKVIPFYDAEAAAGHNNGMDMSPISRATRHIQIGGFLSDSETAIQVFGNSMIPNYPPGCVIGVKPWNERFIEPGKVYVIETEENRFIKRLYYNNDRTAYRCLSDNHIKHLSGPMEGEYCYPEFEIPFDDARQLHRVVGIIKRSIL